MPQVHISWSTDPANAEQLAKFFVRNVDLSYISHGELQLGRAVDSDHWAPDLARMVAEEIRGAGADREQSGLGVVMATVQTRLAALALVSFHRGVRTGYAALDDLVVARELRAQGIGGAVVDWIAKEVRAGGYNRMFLETGIENREAHAFFERHGFRPCSLVMVTRL